MREPAKIEFDPEINTGLTGAPGRTATVLGGMANVLHHVGGLVFLPALVLVVGYDIFMRYVLVTPSEWANEMSSVLLAAVFFLSLAEVTLRGHHLATDILYARFNRRMRGVADIIAGLLGLSFLGVVLWQMAAGMRDSIRYGEGTQNVGFPFWPVYALIIASLVVTILMFIARAVYTFVGKAHSLAKVASSDDI